MNIILPHQFKPRWYQKEFLRASFIDGIKHQVAIWHRRAGKSLYAINVLLGFALIKPGLYLHLFPEQKQARRAIWNGIDSSGRRYLDYIPKQLIKSINNTEMMVTLINGSIIQIGGADNYNSLMGSNPKGIIFDEYSLQNPLAYHYLSPILVENGGWALFIYTPRGYNHGYDLYSQNLDNPEWYVRKYGVDQTTREDGLPIVTLEMVEAERRRGMPEELIRQEFYCDFEAALVGAYYSKELDQAEKDGRIREFEIDRQLRTYTSWDLGWRDATSIWIFQASPNEIRFIHYYENKGHGLKHYIDYLGEFSRKNNVHFHKHFAPHDIEVHELGIAKSRRQFARELGLTFHVTPKIDIADGIQSVRQIFQRLWFHKTQCKFGINALKQYQVGKNGEPLHDWSSHCADSLRTMAVGWYDVYRDENPMQAFNYGNFII